jgi:hypothetical protein
MLVAIFDADAHKPCCVSAGCQGRVGTIARVQVSRARCVFSIQWFDPGDVSRLPRGTAYERGRSETLYSALGETGQFEDTGSVRRGSRVISRRTGGNCSPLTL